MIRMLRNPIDSFVEDVNLMNDGFAKLFARNGQPVAVPGVDVWQDAEAVYAELDLPGVNPADLDVTVTEGNVLTIQGERKPAEVAKEAWVRRERGHGKFARTVELPFPVDASKVEAKYEAGVLRVTLPKSEAAKPRKIAVK
jgi:HSP20 family protein